MGLQRTGHLIRRLLNPFMLWGALLGFLIRGGYAEIQDTWRHHGPGVISYEDGYEKVSEQQYKRHHYVMGGFGLAIGLGGWILVALHEPHKEGPPHHDQVGTPPQHDKC